MIIPFLVVDTETGGLDPTKASIISIAGQLVYAEDQVLKVPAGQDEANFESLVQPVLPVHPEAAEINGYTEEAWADAPSAKGALNAFCRWCDKMALIFEEPMWTGCNPVFDAKFLAADCERTGVELPSGLSYRLFDVQNLALPLLWKGEIENLKLATLRKWVGAEGEQEHTASGDVIDTIEVLEALLAKYAKL